MTAMAYTGLHAPRQMIYIKGPALFSLKNKKNEVLSASTAINMGNVKKPQQHTLDHKKLLFSKYAITDIELILR